MAKFLGIDVGTSGCKVLLIDEKGTLLKQASAEYPLETPKPLWTQQNPEDWWLGVQRCLQEIGEPRPDAIGLTGQMHGAVFLDAKGEVVRPAILWNDQRTVDECAEMDRKVGPERMMALTCNPPLTGFQAPKVLWLRNHEPENFARTKHILLPKDYIRYRLTGVMATEVSDASGTAAFDVPNRRWSEEVLSANALGQGLFPECFESDVVSSSTVMGVLEEGVPVVGGGGDQAAGAVGTGAVVPGVVSVSLGTSGVVFTALTSPSYDPSGATHTFCHANRAWHAMGVMLSCGGAIRWVRDVLYGGSGFAQMNADAATAEQGSLGLQFLPYLAGERTPHKDPHARGGWVGATLAHSRTHLARSAFEGVTFGLADGFEVLKGLGASTSELRVTGGGAKSEFWLQMLADVFGAPCVTLSVDEGPAFGAAILAGVGAGEWPDTEAATKQVVRVASRVDPSGADYRPSMEAFRALYPALAGWFRR
ncbi:MAG: xylulokinase [Armatimonadetes bacterium]|nr:xylulokinase [Armatimonadota bacterium]